MNDPMVLHHLESSTRRPPSDQSTVLITNGNLLSMLSLGNWLAEFGTSLRAVVITTKLPSTKSNISGLLDMFWRSGPAYTYFKLNTNRFLPMRFSLWNLPTTVPDLLRLYGLSADVTYVDNVNAPDVIEHIRSYSPSILLSFSATSRFSDTLIEVPSRVAVNIHYALLPEYAGLSPYYWYLAHREPVAGITMHVIHSKLDAGPIICQERCETTGIDSVTELLIRQMELVSPALSRFYEGELHEDRSAPQDLSKRSYFRHPTRHQVREFRRSGLVFTRYRDVLKLAEMAKTLRARAPEVQRKAADSRRTVEDAIVGMSPQCASVARTWYIPPTARPQRGFLVYSLDFVLATLQGSITEPHRVRRSMIWLGLGTIVRSLMAVAQVFIMLLSWTPILNWFVETMARTFTRNAAGFFLRSCYWKAKLKNLGTDTIIDQGVEIWGPGNVSIGSHCHIDTNVRLAAGERRQRQHGSIRIGNYVHLGPGVHIAGRGGVEIGDCVGIMANAHLYSATGVVERPNDPGMLVAMSHMAPHEQQYVIEAPIRIHDRAFVGMMTRIMPGVDIGYGAVIHANCELTRDVPAFANVGGVPRGRQIGWRMPRRPSPQLDTVPGPEPKIEPEPHPEPHRTA